MNTTTVLAHAAVSSSAFRRPAFFVLGLIGVLAFAFFTCMPRRISLSTKPRSHGRITGRAVSHCGSTSQEAPAHYLLVLCSCGSGSPTWPLSGTGVWG